MLYMINSVSVVFSLALLLFLTCFVILYHFQGQKGKQGLQGERGSRGSPVRGTLSCLKHNFNKANDVCLKLYFKILNI